jgi:psp operon transcriptional activator
VQSVSNEAKNPRFVTNGTLVYHSNRRNPGPVGTVPGVSGAAVASGPGGASRTAHGRTGTGKELAATRLHFLSRRWDGPFVSLNAAALSPSLIEAELFGHEKGAFTGADRHRTGRFEAAHRGTLFLDEIGMIPMEVQEKILRVVEYNVFERVGGSHPVEVDVRIIGATNADLAGLARQGRFKQDLLDRLSFEVLFLPPLRVRGEEDILLLASHFASRMALETGCTESIRFSPAVRHRLLTHFWPGNVRELKNVVERAVYRAAGPLIREITLDPFRNPYGPAGGETGSSPHFHQTPSATRKTASGFKSAIRDLERSLVTEALDASGGNQKQAAALLGLSYHQLRGLIRKHGEALGFRTRRLLERTADGKRGATPPS